jgi:3-dehydroquinate synthase
VPLDRRVRFPDPPATSRFVIRRGSLDALGALARDTTRAERAAVVTDPRVGRLYGARALASLRRAGLRAEIVVVPRGERAKSTGVLAGLWDAFARLGLGRRDAVVALGGGVALDLAGFAAATWLRGVPWVGVPSSLLAQVDASVGGKTAIDLSQGKNLAGAFHHPALVVIDPDLLITLPFRHVRAGLAEIVKMGMAVDADLFRWLERHADALAAADPAQLERAVARAVAAKLAIVRRDPREREGGVRTSLNYGHTLGHAIEAASAFRGLLHGEAVAVGMRAAAEISVRVAGLDPRARARQDALLDRLGLPRRMPPTPIARVLRAMASDKKGRGYRPRWVLTPQMGRASVPRPIASQLVRAVVLRLGARS